MLESRVNLLRETRDYAYVPLLREASELKNVTKSGKSPPGGGRGKHKKSKIRNLDFLIRGRGSPIFQVFP